MGRTFDRGACAAAIIAQIQEAVREVRCAGSQRLLRRGISMAHLHVMALLARHGELGMSRIAEVLDVSVSNATGLIDRMEERGLVARARVPADRRAVHVRLTEAGRSALADLELVREDVIGRVLAHLDDSQLERLGGAIDDVRTAVLAAAAEDPEVFGHSHDLHATYPTPVPMGRPTHRPS